MPRGWKIGVAVAALWVLLAVVYVFAVEPAMAPKPFVGLSPRVQKLVKRYQKRGRRADRLFKVGTKGWVDKILESVDAMLEGKQPPTLTLPPDEGLWKGTVELLDDSSVTPEEKVVVLCLCGMSGKFYPEEDLKRNVLNEQALARMRPPVLVALSEYLWSAPLAVTDGFKHPRAPIVGRYAQYAQDVAKLAARKDPSEGIYALAWLSLEYLMRYRAFGNYDSWPEEAKPEFRLSALEAVRAFNRAGSWHCFYPAPHLWPMTNKPQWMLDRTSGVPFALDYIPKGATMLESCASGTLAKLLCQDGDVDGLLELQTFCERRMQVQPAWGDFSAIANHPLDLYAGVAESVSSADVKKHAEDLRSRIKDLKQAESDASPQGSICLNRAQWKKVDEPFLIKLQKVLAEGRALIESLTPEDFEG